MIDYLVIGLGVAGIAFCEQLEQHKKKFRVFTDQSQQASRVAGGLYNPVVLKRFTLAWKAAEQLQIALPFYRQLEKKLGVKLDYSIPILRRFASIEEQNLWFEAADRPSLKPFLSTQLLTNKNPSIEAPNGFGEVLGTGRVDTKELLETYTAYLINKGLLNQESFDHEVLKIYSDSVSYKGIDAGAIVFTSGFGLKKNPLFKDLPLVGNKGELLTIRAPQLGEHKIIKASVFIIPLGDDLYRVGATYNPKEDSNEPTSAARDQIVKKLKTIINCDYEIVEHVAGIRPTVSDRRPLVGRHHEYSNVYVLNGLGSRGVLIAPYAAAQLYNYSTKGIPLDPVMDIIRFKE